MRAVVAVMLAGCWSNTPVVAPSSPPPDPMPEVTVSSRRPSHYRSPCEVALDHVVDILREEIEKVPDLADKVGAVRDAAVASCNETRWTDDVLRCFGNANEASELGVCQTQLTPDQTTDLMRRLTEASGS